MYNCSNYGYLGIPAVILYSMLQPTSRCALATQVLNPLKLGNFRHVSGTEKKACIVDLILIFVV